MKSLIQLKAIVVLATLSAVGCTTPIEETPHQSTETLVGSRVKMSDLAILFPLSGEIRTYLPLSAVGSRGTLVPKATYTAAKFDQPVRSLAPRPYEEFAAVALRLDPCGNRTAPYPADGEGCQPQLRLVFQAISGTTKVATVDDGVHAIYSLTRAQFVEVVRSVTLLRPATTTTSPGPLRVHPIMESQGFTGPYAVGLKSLVLQYAGSENLVRLARMNGVETSGPWEFNASDIAPDGTATEFVIPHLQTPTTQTSIAIGITEPLIHDVDDVSGGFPPLVNPNPTEEERLHAIDATLRIENPTIHTAQTVDCGSCHGAMLWRNIADPEGLGIDVRTRPNFYVQDRRYVTDAEMKSNGASPRAPNFHMFGYMGRTPVVMQRVLDDTAEQVAYVNQNMPL